MADLRDILAAFEENLVLARELGAKTIELDRSLLSPLPKAAVKVVEECAQPQPQKSPQPQQPQTQQQSAPAEIAGSPLILFAGVKMTDAGAELFGKMVAAMGCAEGETAFVEVPKPSTGETSEALVQSMTARAPKVIVLFGIDAMVAVRTAGVKVHRSVWGELRGIPAVATCHPDFILTTWKDDQAQQNVAKAEVWKLLKDALAKIGRTPPKR